MRQGSAAATARPPPVSPPYPIISTRPGLVHAGELFLDVRDGAARVEVLGADLGAVHDGVAPVQLSLG